MGDYGPLALTLYRADSEESVATCRKVIWDYELNDEGGDGPSDYGEFEPFKLRFGEPWQNYEIRSGTIYEINNTLEALGDVWYKIQTDPMYDWMGELILFAPGLGKWERECDANGNARFMDGDIYLAVDYATTGRRSAVDVMTGKPWFDEFALITAKRGAPPLEPR